MWYQVTYTMLGQWVGNRIKKVVEIKAENVAGAKKEVKLRWPKNDVKIVKVTKMSDR